MIKRLVFLFTVFLTTIFSSVSFADWTWVSKNVDRTNFYVDFERIRKHDGYVYYWELGDYLQPNKFGLLSGKVYKQVDCKLLRYKTLSFSFHKEPMGGGTGDRLNLENREWQYPSPNSAGEDVLKSVCSW
ncbi:hypothetical protein N9467_02715 [Litorivicinus sp.]|nr:hypothetical protein [Litorivicinus sp.]